MDMCTTCTEEPMEAKEQVGSLDLEFQVVPSHPMCVLGLSLGLLQEQESLLPLNHLSSPQIRLDLNNMNDRLILQCEYL